MNHIRLKIYEPKGFARLTLRRDGTGAHGNAVHPPMFAELRDAFSQLRGCKTLRGVDVIAHGDHFCVGRDMIACNGAHEAETQLMAYQTLVAFDRLRLIKRIVVHGCASGFGAALMLCGDLVYVTRDATVSFPEGKHGFPSLSAALLLRALPNAKAMGILLHPQRTYSARDCLTIGLVTGIVQSRQFLFSRREQSCIGLSPEYVHALLALKARMQAGGLEPLVEAERICVTKYLGEPNVLKRIQASIQGASANLIARRR